MSPKAAIGRLSLLSQAAIDAGGSPPIHAMSKLAVDHRRRCSCCFAGLPGGGSSVRRDRCRPEAGMVGQGPPYDFRSP
jgi:hypothetical protein